MKYYLVAGESSGDLHGGNLMRAIKQEDSQAEFRFFGGDQMLSQGGTLVKHYREMAFMGFVEVVKNLRTILKNIQKAQEDILHFQPDVLVLIDYPGFNLKLAKFAKEKGIRVVYYISPKVWAWKESRVKKIKAYVDQLITILPFETEFYKKHQMDVFYVGNPLLDAVENYKGNSEPILAEKPILALLPGSRKQELEKMLPVMAQAAQTFASTHEIIVACTKDFSVNFYKELLGGVEAKMVVGRTYDLLSSASLAAVTSGTATLETGIFQVPQVVCYKGNALTIWIAKRLVNLNYISLVNLIMDQMLVKELIQEDLTPDTLSRELRKVHAGEGRLKVEEGYKKMIEVLGGSGASLRAAKVVVHAE